ncbi:hypothetical protein GLOIN_2v1777499 [Rhizophagus clarus]|uniref:Uncharacterized protein n=1 Tax=Rhizophagus clarus TaxID=94130 RepID=A0A8H3QPI4_9GLOM|nr:hypothetical protein GLOIN_2v1777499 [Rhizophagus clarus]
MVALRYFLDQSLIDIIKTTFDSATNTVELDIHCITQEAEHYCSAHSRYQTFILTKDSTTDEYLIGIPNQLNFNTDTVTFRHYTVVQDLSTAHEVILRPCIGCDYNESLRQNTCLALSTISSSVYLQKTQNTKYSPNAHFLSINLNDKKFILTELISSNFLQLSYKNASAFLDNTKEQEVLSVSALTRSPSFSEILWESLPFECSDHSKQLLLIQQRLSKFTDLEFYTDGSMINPNSTQNGIPVEHRLRHFLKTFTDCKNFETLYNLNRNAKYRQHNISIDWRRTLSLLSSSNFANNTTSFEELLYKSFKIKLFMDEVLTLEHTKKYFYHLYDDTNCVLCGDLLEDLTHIWLCPEVVQLTRHHLQSTFHFIQQFIHDSSLHTVNYQDIASLPIWDLVSSHQSFTFIDLFRNFIPYQLSLFLEQYLSSSQITALFNNLSEQHIMFTKTQIWIPQCQALSIWEENMGITRQLKKRSYGLIPYSNHRLIDDSNQEHSCEELLFHLRFATNIFDYYINCVS